ncbi:MAG: hypothetical protein JSR82_05715 [Verrucomicrobia bacterium]|nr:hypothetical protein [Verrucomicrobiota bacterium]
MAGKFLRSTVAVILVPTALCAQVQPRTASSTESQLDPTAALLVSLGSLSPAGLAEFARSARAERPEEQDALLVALVRLASSDGVRALELAATAPAPARDAGLRQRLVARVSEVLCQLDAASAQRAFAALPAGLQDVCVATFRRALNQVDPEHQLVAAVSAQLDEPALRRATRQLALRLGGPAAASRIESLPNPEVRRLASVEVLEVWAEIDPAAALSWAESRPRAESAANAAWNCAVGRPAQLAAYLASRPRDSTTADRLRFVAEFWSWSDLDAALAWMRRLPEDADRQSAFLGLRERWQRRDTRAVLAEAQRHDAILGQGKFPSTQSVLRTWAARDPAQAQAWLESQVPAETKFGSYLTAVVEGSLEGADDPRGLLRLFDALGPNYPLPDYLTLRRVLNRMAELDFSAARAWSMRLPNHLFATQAITILAYQRLQEEDHESAATLLIERLERISGAWLSQGSYEAGTIFSSVAFGWAQREPARAAAWATRLPPGSIVAEQAAQSVAFAWSNTDALAAWGWSGKLSPPLQRQIRLTILEGLAKHDASAASALVEKLPIDVRRAGENAVWQGWSRSEREAADSWLLQLHPG